MTLLLLLVNTHTHTCISSSRHGVSLKADELGDVVRLLENKNILIKQGYNACLFMSLSILSHLPLHNHFYINITKVVSLTNLYLPPPLFPFFRAVTWKRSLPESSSERWEFTVKRNCHSWAKSSATMKLKTEIEMILKVKHRTSYPSFENIAWASTHRQWLSFSFQFLAKHNVPHRVIRKFHFKLTFSRTGFIQSLSCIKFRCMLRFLSTIQWFCLSVIYRKLLRSYGNLLRHSIYNQCLIIPVHKI